MLGVLSIMNKLDDLSLRAVILELGVAEARARLEAAKQVYLIIEEAASNGLGIEEALRHVSNYVRYLEDQYDAALSSEILLDSILREIKASQATKP